MTNIFEFFTEVLKTTQQRVNFRHEAMLATGWEYSTFYYKVSHQNLSPAEITALGPIIEKYKSLSK